MYSARRAVGSKTTADAEAFKLMQQLKQFPNTSMHNYISSPCTPTRTRNMYDESNVTISFTKQPKKKANNPMIYSLAAPLPSSSKHKTRQTRP
jgi:hypothetical protein